MIKLYDTLRGRKEPLAIKNKKVSLYVCGITPYDTTHLGHAFTYVIFDTLARYLRWQSYQVIYTQNVTDIDDPLFERARKLGVSWRDLGNKCIKRYLDDMKLLGVLSPNYFPKVSEEIPMIIRMVQKLVDKGIAYQRNGNVYFEIKKEPSYGRLCKLKEKEMIPISRERGSDPGDPLKKHPLDFILWQPSKKDEPSWDSPWGKGRPGWHIECSAMAIRYLGESVTIHGGGRDLIFPHHESEIAQSEAYTGKRPFVHHWVHIGMVHHKRKKMSKSLGNLVLIHDLVRTYSPAAIRWYLLCHHYRKDWQFNEKKLAQVQTEVETVNEVLKMSDAKDDKENQEYRLQFKKALEDDLNTVKALDVILKLVHSQVKRRHSWGLLNEFTNVLGIPFPSHS